MSHLRRCEGDPERTPVAHVLQGVDYGQELRAVNSGEPGNLTADSLAAGLGWALSHRPVQRPDGGLPRGRTEVRVPSRHGQIRVPHRLWIAFGLSGDNYLSRLTTTTLPASSFGV